MSSALSIALDLPSNARRSSVSGERLPLDDADAVCHVLLQHAGLVEADLVRRQVMVTDVTRRNRNFVVRVQGWSSLFVTCRVWSSRTDFEREVSHYRRVTATPEMCGRLPALISSDANARICVFEYVEGALDLWGLHRSAPPSCYRVAATVGTAVASLHAATLDCEPADTPLGVDAPWVLSVHRPRAGALRELTEATIDLIRMLQASPSLCALLDEARESWNHATPIHGDVTWSNVLVKSPSGSATLIDWERSGLGEPAFDMAGALVAYLTFWIHTRGRVGSRGFGHLELRAMARTCWQAYRDALPANVINRTSCSTLMAFVCARLLQTAYETTQALDRLPRPALEHMKLATTISRDPLSAARDLLGLTSHDFTP